MKSNIALKGVLLVALGASFYGMLATFVKLAYHHGFTTAEVTTSQFVLGIFGMFLIMKFQQKFSKRKLSEPTSSERKKLMIAGTSMGFTSLLYYISVQYINVSVAIVLLMQSVWISVFLEALITKKMPQARKIFAVLIVLFGTALATNVFHQESFPDWRGLAWGFLAAISFSVNMFAANTIATHSSPFSKTFFMLLGGGIIIALFLFFSQIGPYYFETLRNVFSIFSENQNNVRPFDFSIFWRYGWILSLFGTVLPPILFNSGFPKTGLGLGGIVSSVELPVSVTMAFLVLNEKVVLLQWLGIALILLAIVMMNLPTLKRSRVREID